MLFDLMKFFIVLYIIIGSPLLFYDVSEIYEKYGVSFDIILIYLTSTLSVLVIYFVTKTSKVTKDHLGYVALLQVLSLFYAISGPLSVLMGRDDPANIGNYLYIGFDEDYVVRVIFLFLLFQIGIAIGSLFPVNGIKFNLRFSAKRAVPLCWLMLIASSLPYLLLATSRGITIGGEYIDAFNALSGSGRVYLYLGFFKLLPLSILLFYYIYNRKYTGVFFVLLLIIISTLIKPSRGLLLSTILMATLSYNYFHHYISLKKLLGIVIIILFLSISIVTIRSHSEIGGNIAKKVTEGNAMFENTYVVYKYLQNSGTFRLGKDYLTSPLRFVPQKLVPGERTQPLPMWLMETFYPEMMESGGGRMFSIIAESYLNFSFAGPLLFGILLSIVFKKLYLSMMKIRVRMDSNSIHLIPIFYIYLCGQIYYLLRGDVISFLVRIFSYTILPLFVLIIFSKSLFSWSTPKNETTKQNYLYK
jgi:oligosaccharide repeat unit polymerase